MPDFNPVFKYIKQKCYLTVVLCFTYRVNLTWYMGKITQWWNSLGSFTPKIGKLIYYVSSKKVFYGITEKTSQQLSLLRLWQCRTFLSWAGTGDATWIRDSVEYTAAPASSYCQWRCLPTVCGFLPRGMNLKRYHHALWQRKLMMVKYLVSRGSPEEPQCISHLWVHFCPGPNFVFIYYFPPVSGESPLVARVMNFLLQSWSHVSVIAPRVRK